MKNIKTFAEQAKTINDVRNKVRKYGCCVAVRPTGFGKTHMMTELIGDYKNVLYLYPAAVIRDDIVAKHYQPQFDELLDEEGALIDPETQDTVNELQHKLDNKIIDNCTLMTYSKLIRLSQDDFDDMDYDAIFLDEVHRIGARQTRIAIDKLFTALPDAHKIGATATPIRMDNIDVISIFFNDIMAYTYTMLDAMNDKLLAKPNYCYCSYDYQKDLEHAIEDNGMDIKDPVAQDIISTNVIEMAKIFNMETVIKDTCNQYAVDTNYMKFIIFFANKRHMDDKLSDVENWFKSAYPDHNVNTLKISSKSKTESQNIEKLPNLVYKNKTIDLIACIDMLNLGYHVKNLTGIMMYRGTASSTIFIQQLGRALSSDADNSSIVFDIVDNLHRKAVFELRSKLVNKPLRNRSPKTSQAKLTDYYISDTDNVSLACKDKDGNEVIKANLYLDNNNNIVMKTPNGNIIPSTLTYDCDDGKIYDTSAGENNPAKNINEITDQCIVATGHIAKYREFLKKAMVEPLVQKCKYALEVHFRSWCWKHNIEYPISDTKLKTMYNMSKEDFFKEMSAIIKAKNINYPLHDAKNLLQIGEDDDTAPLWVCAKNYDIAAETILDEFGIK